LCGLAGTKHQEKLIPLPKRNILNAHHDHEEEKLVIETITSVSKIAHPTQQLPSSISPVTEEEPTTLPLSQPPPLNSTTLFTFPSLPLPPQKVTEVIIRYDCGESQRFVPEPTEAEEELSTTNNANNNKDQATNSTAFHHHHHHETDPPPTSNEQQISSYPKQKKHITDRCLRSSTTTTRMKKKLVNSRTIKTPMELIALKLVNIPTMKTPMELIALLRGCKTCVPKRRFESRREGIDHLKDVHGKKYCPVCFISVSRRGNVLKDHFLQFHATNRTEETALCPYCQMSCSYEGMYQHICRRHLIPLEENPPYHIPQQEEYNLRRRRPFRVTRTKLGNNCYKNYDDTPTSSDELHY
jgi:hypothetical protein